MVQILFSGQIGGSMGNALQTLPLLFMAIPKRRVKRRTVQDALTNQAWVSDIQGALTVGVIVDNLHLWDLLMDFQLEPEVEDRHLWRLSSNRQYSAKSAYEGFFLGSTLFGQWERIWKSWAPPKCHVCGWSRTIIAGRLIAWHIMGYLIRSIVLFVTKKRRLSTISLSIVYSQENFGLICSDRSVFRACPLSLQSYPSMIGGRKLAAAPLMS